MSAWEWLGFGAVIALIAIVAIVLLVLLLGWAIGRMPRRRQRDDAPSPADVQADRSLPLPQAKREVRIMVLGTRRSGAEDFREPVEVRCGVAARLPF
jgi:hypothetical protein